MSVRCLKNRRNKRLIEKITIVSLCQSRFYIYQIENFVPPPTELQVKKPLLGPIDKCDIHEAEVNSSLFLISCLSLSSKDFCPHC